MKQVGKCIVGDPVAVETYTSDWLSVKLHPTIFYRRFDQIQDGFRKVKGLYAEIDQGQYVSIRFSDKDDLTAFHKIHHDYL